MAQAYAYGLILLTVGSLFLLLLRQVWKRRNIQPLKIREPYLMIISLLGGFIILVMICFREINPEMFSCSAYIWISNMFEPLFLLPYVLRILRLKYIYHWSQQRAYGENYGKWYHTNRKWVSKGVLLIIVMICLLIQIVLAYFMDLYAKYKDEDAVMEDRPGCAFGYEFYPFLIVSLAYAILLIGSLVSLRNVREQFGIRREMKQCITIWIPCATLFFLCNLWKPLFWLNDWFATSTWIILMIVGSSIVSYLFPLICTHNIGDQLSGINYSTNVTNAYRTLEDILGEETGIARQKFLKYLTESFCPEYLKFLNDVDAYKDADQDGRSNSVHEIRSKYLEIGGELYLDCLKNKSSIKDEITTVSRNHNMDLNFPRDLFDKAYDEVKTELRKNHFNGFLKSEHYDDLLRKLNTHPNIITELQDSNML